MSNIRRLKKAIIKHSEECGYTLNKSNEPYQNISRIESMKAHYQQIKTSENLDHEMSQSLEVWINNLARKFT